VREILDENFLTATLFFIIIIMLFPVFFLEEKKKIFDTSERRAD
jgi:hypothetical protein